MKPNVCWTTNQRAHFCYVIRLRRSSYFPSHFGSMADRCMPASNNSITNSGKDFGIFFLASRKWKVTANNQLMILCHNCSFDCHDSSVYTSKTVTGLLEHYKDPGCVMFFEPALTIPLNRNFVFSLQQLCRATIVSHTTYDGINEICLPKKLKSYLKEYHYKQHVRVKRFDEPIYGTSWIWCFIILFSTNFLRF